MPKALGWILKIVPADMAQLSELLDQAAYDAMEK